MLPATSFIKVGENLHEDPFLHEQTLSSTTIDAGKEEHKHQEKDMIRIASRGALIIPLDEGQSQELTIDTIDIETYNDMCDKFSKKNRIYKLIIFFFTFTTLYSIYSMERLRKREKHLNLKLQQLKDDMERLTRFSLNEKGDDDKCSDASVFGFENCYFKVQTSASLGQCTKNWREDMNEWYEKVIYDAYSGWWNEYFGTYNASSESSSENEAEAGKEIPSEHGNLEDRNRIGWTWYSTDYI